MKRAPRIGFGFLFILGFAASARAFDLQAPYELENAQLLPDGVRGPRVKNLFMSIDSKYDGGGVAQPLGLQLHKGVTWNDVVNGQATERDRANTRGALRYEAQSGPGYELNDSLGSTTGQINVSASVTAPILQVGITDRLSAAVVIPVFHLQIQADTGFASNRIVNDFVRTDCERRPANCADTKAKFNDGLANGINSKLVAMGYQAIRSDTFTALGDVELVGKYLVFQEGPHAVSVKGSLTLPTGRGPDDNKAVDVPTGDGQIDWGTLVAWDYNFQPQWQLSTAVGYTIQFDDHREMRIPTSADVPLSADKEYVARNLGDQILAGSILYFKLPSVGITLGSGYTYQYYKPSSFSGNEFAAERYGFLAAQHPLQVLQTATASAEFSTTDWYLQKKFAVPFRANIIYSHPIAGLNVANNDIVTGELSLFF